MNDTQLLCWGGLWKAFLAVRVIEEANLRSPDRMRAEPFLRIWVKPVECWGGGGLS